MDIVTLSAHQGGELLACAGVAHAFVDGVHEPELPALAPRGGMVLRRGHGLHFFLFLAFLKHRQVQHLAYLIVALAERDKLRFADVELPSVLQRDAVDDKMRVDVAAVGMSADQHLASLKIFTKLHRRGVRRDRIDIGALWERLHHVEEQGFVILVVEKLRAEEIVIDALRTAVDPADQRLLLPQRFFLPLRVLHDRRHAGTVLPLGVIRKTDDGYFGHLPRSAISRSVSLISFSA